MPIDNTVYPRVCGGTPVQRRRFKQQKGLSPRVRGNHDLAVHHAAPARGISPRVRGNPLCRWVLTPGTRSIPACAGEPWTTGPAVAANGVYPRVCGGTPGVRTAEQPTEGLSPRVRGNRLGETPSAQRRGSIPACAGEPDCASRFQTLNRVYPRVCGGTIAPFVRESRRIGLSPRVRGNPVVVCPLRQHKRSIPACAGEPRPGKPSIQGIWVYPRVCGGTGPVPDRGRLSQGLSPRVRGNRASRWPASPSPGSIPACAGEPSVILMLLRPVRVYPRVCGGTVSSHIVTVLCGGLSPRVRGNPYVANGNAVADGSIPACAGEP